MSWFDQLRELGDPVLENARVERESDRLLNGIIKFSCEPHHAYHEAGHAVVAIHFGWPFARVYAASKGFLGRVEDIQYETDDELALLALFLAGPIAQARFLGWDFWETLTPQVDSEDPGVVADFDMIAELLGRARSEVGKEDLTEALQLANSILDIKQDLFNSIAEALISRQELLYDEVCALVNRSRSLG